jgi:hypothetical protein
MTQKTYRTAQGKVVDLGALQLQNEHVRAVGNMPINARGDLIDSNNRPIDTRNQEVARQYRKQISNVQDAPVYSSRQPAAPVTETVKPAVDPAAEIDAGGLAAAINRARNQQ